MVVTEEMTSIEGEWPLAIQLKGLCQGQETPPPPPHPENEVGGLGGWEVTSSIKFGTCLALKGGSSGIAEAGRGPIVALLNGFPPDLSLGGVSLFYFPQGRIHRGVMLIFSGDLYRGESNRVENPHRWCMNVSLIHTEIGFCANVYVNVQSSCHISQFCS